MAIHPSRGHTSFGSACRPGYKIPPVKYPDDRVTTIFKGIMWNAEGERYDPMKMKELGGRHHVRHAS